MFSSDFPPCRSSSDVAAQVSVTALLMSLTLISSTAVGPAHADRHSASLKPLSGLNECHHLCEG